MKRLGAVVVLVGAVVVVLGLFARPKVGGDYGICLPERYFIISAADEFQTLSRRDATHPTIYDRILAGTIVEWGERRGVVTGVLDTAVFKDQGWGEIATERSVAGYFILDTKTQELRSGLTETAYLDRLRELGVEPPRLHHLSRLQQYSLRCLFGDAT